MGKTVYFGHRRVLAQEHSIVPMSPPVEPTNGNGGRSEVASYVASLSADLASLSRRSGLETLGYLLEMVRLEAESVTRHNGNGRR
jgi:hypothetical protein